MKVLILSCNTGGGHNSAAKAVREYLESAGVVCETRDALAFQSRFKSKVISGGHVFIYKHLPKMFGAGYRFIENHPSKPGNRSLMYHLVQKGAEALNDFLIETGYDTIVSTHIFASLILTEIRKRYPTKFKTYFIATDYTCSPGVDEIDADIYFIPHKSLASEFTGNGLPADRLVASGIPVRRVFYERACAEDAKIALGLPAEKRVILMMCGSMGCGPLRELAEELSTRMPKDTELVVVCGNNKRLHEKFKKLGELPNVHVIGFTDKIHLYMDAASLIMTKPGGLSSTEAATKGLPMVLIDAVPGCESKNMTFFLQNGFALTAADTEGLLAAVESLLSDHDRADIMSKALSSSFSSYAAEVIGNYVLSEVSETHGRLS